MFDTLQEQLAGIVLATFAVYLLGGLLRGYFRQSD